jgi:hypothetical protein
MTTLDILAFSLLAYYVIGRLIYHTLGYYDVPREKGVIWLWPQYSFIAALAFAVATLLLWEMEDNNELPDE